jgi:hypothetical protein
VNRRCSRWHLKAPENFKRMRTKTSHLKPSAFAVCVDNSDYEGSLELHKIYAVVGDPEALRDGDLRVIDESGEDYLYAAERFVGIDVPGVVERAILKQAS